MPAASDHTPTALDAERQRIDDRQKLVDDVLADRQLIVASNRGPVSFTEHSDGHFTARQGSGGLVTAVSAVLKEHQAIWIAAAMGEGDRARAKQAADSGETLITPHGTDSQFRLRFVVPTQEAYHRYYNIISNPLLWFLQHYLWDTPRSPDITHHTWTAWRDGYVQVNQLFADEVLVACEQLPREPVIMLQDYQLYLAGGMIRAKRPNAILQHFIHIPWPDPDYWRLLPREMRQSICEGLLGL